MKIKSFLKSAGLLVLATLSVSTAVTLAGCKVQTEEPPVVIPEPDKVPMDKVDDLLSKLKNGSYTVAVKNLKGEVTSVYSIDGENSQIYDKKTLSKIINSVENGNAFTYTYNSTTGVWVKDEAAEIFNVDNVAYDILSSIKWTNFDSVSNKYEGTLQDKDISVLFTTEGVVVLGAENFDITKVGTTEISYPKEYVDHTCKEIPMEEVYAFWDKLKTGSFTFEKVNGMDGGYSRFEVVGDSYHVYGPNDKTGVIYTVEDDKYYVYIKEADGKWHKNETESFNIRENEEFLNLVLNGKWVGYDSEKDVYYLNASSTAEVSIAPVYVVEIKDDYVSVEGLEGRIQFSKFGTTTLNMPKESEIVDDTVIVTPPEPDTPIVDKDVIYTIDEKGNYNFNIVLMKEVLENWMKGDNQFGKDVLAEKYYDNTLVSDRIYYIDASKEKIEMGLLNHNEDRYEFGTFKLTDKNLFAELSNGEYQTKSSFVEYLNSIKKTNYSCDGIAIDEKFAEMNEKCDIILNNILDKLATTGYQGNNINNDGTKVTDFTNIDRSKVIFGFKDKSSDTFPGYGLGNIKEWNLYLVLFNNENKLEYIKIGIVATLSNGAKDEYENVLNNTDKTWMITGIERKPIDDSNKVLYQEIENSKTVTQKAETQKRIAVRGKVNDLKK